MNPKPLTRRSWLLLMLAFTGTLGAMFFWLMWILAPKLNHLRQSGDVFYECLEVVSGDEILVRDIRTRNGEPVAVKIRGITAPPLEAGPAADAFAKLAGIPADKVPELGRISRNCLVPWLFKQSSIQLDYDRNAPEKDAQGRLFAYVSLSLIDVGVMQLREGQAIPDSTPHKHATIYNDMVNKARTQNIGIWRP